VIAQTLRALVEPRRLGSILVIAIPLVVAQREAWVAPWLYPVIVILTFGLVAFATVGYRALLGVDRPRGPILPRILAYSALSMVAPLLLWGLPPLLRMGPPLIGATWTVVISAGLFWVGGYGLGRDIDLEHGWKIASARAEALSKQAEMAELMALRAQLDPHFLFNTLNAIAEWCREDPLVAERALVDLSSMLRDMMNASRASDGWTLSDELKMVSRLFELHRLRDPDRFTVSVALDEETRSLPIPPLVLLPLAENAMKHGPGRGQRGLVSISASRAGARTLIALENPGAFAGRRAGGEGLATVERRLATWSPNARLDVRDANGRTRAEVSF